MDPLIYVSRADTKKRPVVNERETEASLAGMGFRIVVPGTLPLSEQITIFRAARLVVGPHGAGLTNIAFCQRPTRVLELASTNYPNPCFARIAQTRGLEYYAERFGAGRATGNVHVQPWTIDIPRLEQRVRELMDDQ